MKAEDVTKVRNLANRAHELSEIIKGMNKGGDGRGRASVVSRDHFLPISEETREMVEELVKDDLATQMNANIAEMEKIIAHGEDANG